MTIVMVIGSWNYWLFSFGKTEFKTLIGNVLDRQQAFIDYNNMDITYLVTLSFSKGLVHGFSRVLACVLSRTSPNNIFTYFLPKKLVLVTGSTLKHCLTPFIGPFWQKTFVAENVWCLLKSKDKSRWDSLITHHYSLSLDLYHSSFTRHSACVRHKTEMMQRLCLHLTLFKRLCHAICYLFKS